MDKAWHLRQDGKAFPVRVHMYCMGDEDLSSEAEAAAFIISSDSKDKDLAEYVLDAWMALLIEEAVSYTADEEAINNTIVECLKKLPYHFQYPLSESQLLAIHKRQDNFSDIDTLYDFIDAVREDIENTQDKIKKSLNQQFCRVRYGGQYNSHAGNSEIWFRISSINYNWVNTIYVFVSSIYKPYKISQITICRDSESDDSGTEYFYKAKDGTLYKHMPIDEYLAEEHEHSPVFESINLNEGILCTCHKLMSIGETYREAINCLGHLGLAYKRDLWRYYLEREKSRNCVVSKL